MSPLGGAIWCLVFALAVLALLMLAELITVIEDKQDRR
jgi:hypothetical protein